MGLASVQELWDLKGRRCVRAFMVVVTCGTRESPRCLSVPGQVTLESSSERNGVDLHSFTSCCEVRVISQLVLVAALGAAFFF